MTVRTLSDDEIFRVRREVLDNVMAYGATPYVSILSVYQIVKDYVLSSSVDPTTSTTAVTDAGPTVLTLASVTGLNAGDRVVVDSDDQRETLTIRAITGSTISVVCRKTHSGTYPVEVESGLTLVRGLLSDLITLEGLERDAPAQAGLKRVDEVEWDNGGSTIRTLSNRRMQLRMELANACGIGWVIRDILARNSGGNAQEVY